MVLALTIIETVLLTIVGVILVLGLISTTGKDALEKGVSEVTIFVIDVGIIACILGIVLLWMR